MQHNTWEPSDVRGPLNMQAVNPKMCEKYTWRWNKHEKKKGQDVPYLSTEIQLFCSL